MKKEKGKNAPKKRKIGERLLEKHQEPAQVARRKFLHLCGIAPFAALTAGSGYLFWNAERSNATKNMSGRLVPAKSKNENRFFFGLFTGIFGVATLVFLALFFKDSMGSEHPKSDAAKNSGEDASSP